jgi:hypothetical protein
MIVIPHSVYQEARIRIQDQQSISLVAVTTICVTSGAGRRGPIYAGRSRPAHLVHELGRFTARPQFSIFDSWNPLEVGILCPENCSMGSRRAQDHTVGHWQPVLDAETGGRKRQRRAFLRRPLHAIVGVQATFRAYHLGTNRGSVLSGNTRSSLNCGNSICTLSLVRLAPST